MSEPPTLVKADLERSHYGYYYDNEEKENIQWTLYPFQGVLDFRGNIWILRLRDKHVCVTEACIYKKSYDDSPRYQYEYSSSEDPDSNAARDQVSDYCSCHGTYVSRRESLALDERVYCAVTSALKYQRINDVTVEGPNQIDLTQIKVIAENVLSKAKILEAITGKVVCPESKIIVRESTKTTCLTFDLGKDTGEACPSCSYRSVNIGRINGTTVVTVELTNPTFVQRVRQLTTYIDKGSTDKHSFYGITHDILTKVSMSVSSKVANRLCAHKTFIVSGSPGSGKSSLLHFLHSVCTFGFPKMDHYYPDLKRLIDGEIQPRTYILDSDLSKNISDWFETFATSLQTFATSLQNPQSDILTFFLCDDLDELMKSGRSSVESDRLLTVNLMLRKALGRLSSQNHPTFFVATVTDMGHIKAYRHHASIVSSIHELGLPSEPERVAILKECLSMITHSLSEDDITEIAALTQSFSPQDLLTLTKEAVVCSPRCNDVVTIADFIQAKNSVKPRAMDDIKLEVPQTKWEDIGGYKHVKSAIRESVEWPLKYSALFKQLNLKAPSGILLYGPPGCCKTMLAKAIATESSMNFISVKGPEIYNMWLGQSEENIRKIYTRARANAPCVIFFDEVDAIAKKRSGPTSSDAYSRVLCQLLTEMDGVEENKNIITIGATNRPDQLDEAFIRPGRLDRLIYVPLPDDAARRDIFRVHLRVQNPDTEKKNGPEDAPEAECAVSCEQIEQLSEATVNFSGAEIAAVCKEAKMAAFRDHLFNKDCPFQLQFHHIETCLRKFAPRTNLSSLEAYEKFANRIKN